MTNFEELFIKSKGVPIKFNGKEICMYDEFSVKNNDSFILTLENFNSEWKQGIYLETFGLFLINNQKIENKIVLWQDTATKDIEFKLSLPKQGTLLIKNVWDTGDGVMNSWHFGSGINIDKINDNYKRYYCNDGHPDDDFDDIIFTLLKK